MEVLIARGAPIGDLVINRLNPGKGHKLRRGVLSWAHNFLYATP